MSSFILSRPHCADARTDRPDRVPVDAQKRPVRRSRRRRGPHPARRRYQKLASGSVTTATDGSLGSVAMWQPSSRHMSSFSRSNWRRRRRRIAVKTADRDDRSTYANFAPSHDKSEAAGAACHSRANCAGYRDRRLLPECNRCTSIARCAMALHAVIHRSTGACCTVPSWLIQPSRPRTWPARLTIR